VGGARSKRRPEGPQREHADPPLKVCAVTVDAGDVADSGTPKAGAAGAGQRR